MQPRVSTLVFPLNSVKHKAMKQISKIFFSLLFMSLTFLVHAQSESRSVGSFDAISVSTGIDVYLTQGNTESVKVKVDGVDLEDVVTEVSGGRLEIHMKRGKFKSIDVKVYVTFKTLNNISVSSAGSVYSEDKLKFDNLEISASSAGEIEMEMEANSLDIHVSSSAEVELKGKTNQMVAKVSSAGELDAFDLNAKIVDVHASSAGEAKVSASAELEAHASSAGEVRYRGNPQKANTGSSSGGSIKKSS